MWTFMQLFFFFFLIFCFFFIIFLLLFYYQDNDCVVADRGFHPPPISSLFMNIFVTLYWGSVDGVFEIEESGCLESEMNGRRERPEYFCCWQRKGGEWAHAEETSGCRQLFRANRLLSSVMTCYWIPELHNGPVVVSQSAHWTLLRFIKEMIIFTWSNHQRSIIKTDLPSWICNVM